MEIIVTGADGRLGKPLRALWPEARFLSRADCDIRDWEHVAALASFKPDLIVHLAAATAFNAPPNDFLCTNIIGTAHLALLAFRAGARLVFTSTVSVYPCSKGPYTEDAPLQPVGNYAWSKLAGEGAVRQVPNYLIIRGCWYDKLNWPRAVTDGYSTCVPAAQAAAWIKELALSTVQGTINIGGPRRSLYEIVREQNPNVKPITRAELDPLPYAFPREACVDNAKHRAFLAR